MDERFFLLEHVPIYNEYGGVWIALPGSYDSLEAAQKAKREQEVTLEHDVVIVKEVG
jgi:hypothetical protein